MPFDIATKPLDTDHTIDGGCVYKPDTPSLKDVHPCGDGDTLATPNTYGGVPPHLPKET